MSFSLYFVQNNYFSPSSVDKTVAFSNVDHGLQLSVTLQANKTRFVQGEVVNMTFTLTNVSNQTLNVSNLNSFSFFNFYIYDNKNNLVGARNIGAAPTQNVTINLPAKENYTENIQWDKAAFGILSHLNFQLGYITLTASLTTMLPTISGLTH